MNGYTNSKQLKQRQVVSKLKGVPLFLVDRPFVVIMDHDGLQWYDNHWNFKFENGWAASVIKFPPLPSISDNPYEIALLDSTGSLFCDAILMKDIVRCNESEVDVWLNIISSLSPCGQFFMWPEAIYE